MKRFRDDIRHGGYDLFRNQTTVTAKSHEYHLIETYSFQFVLLFKKGRHSCFRLYPGRGWIILRLYARDALDGFRS